MKVSVITPSFNSGHVIERAIRSIQDQHFDSIEHIIVDGGSSDKTLSILKKYDKIRWISEPDLGIYDAMNKGIKLSSGEWLYFLGADDYLMDSSVISNLFEEKNYSSGIVYGNVISPKWESPYDGEFTQSKILSRNICHQAIFYHISIFSQIGMYNLKYKSHADWALNIEIFLDKKIKKVFVDIAIAYFEQGGFSTSGDSIFKNEKSLIIAKKGYGTITPKLYKKHLLRAMKISRKNGSYLDYMLLQLRYRYLKFLKKLPT
jgi:glycosyltransferase involved in cell wall biosynthesis